MPGRHSLTVQVDPSLPGHVAVVINSPAGQTYAGFGPEHHHHASDRGRFDIHSVQPGDTIERDYSNTLGSDPNATFTVPISEAQAKAAHAEIERIKGAVPWYTIKSLSPEVCSTIVSRIMGAAGLGDNLYTVPQVNFEYLSDIADTLSNDPKASITKRSGLPIPDELREIQPDYAYVGGGHDAPSERVHRVVPVNNEFAPSNAPAVFNDRFGNWTVSPQDVATSGPDRPTSASQTGGAFDVGKAQRYLGGRVAGISGASVFDTGTPAVPQVPTSGLPYSGYPASLDRFGNWISSPPISSPFLSDQPTPAPGPNDNARVDSQKIRALSGRLVMPNSSGAGQGRASTPGISKPPAQSGWPPATRPMPDYPIPPMVYGLPDPSAASGDNMDDWFYRLIKPLMQQ